MQSSRPALPKFDLRYTQIIAAPVCRFWNRFPAELSPGLVKSLLQLVSAANRLALPGSPGPNLAVGGPDGEILRTLLTADLLYRHSYSVLPLHFSPPIYADNMWIDVHFPCLSTVVFSNILH